MKTSKLFETLLFNVSNQTDMLPIIKKFQSKNLGGHQSNAGIVEAMANRQAALAEKWTNGIDAVIEKAVDDGKIKTTNVVESLNEITELTIDDPQLFCFVSRLGQGEKVFSIDKGTGIHRDDWENTILSILGSNKLANSNSIGCFNMGGAAVYGHAEHSLIYCRNDDYIVFTAIFKHKEPNDKMHVYKYLVDSDGKPFKFPISELKAPIISDLDAVGAKDARKAATEKQLNNNVLLPESGMVIMNIFSSKVQHYSATGIDYRTYIAERLFGIPLPLRLVNDKIRDRENRKGLRFHLDNIGENNNSNFNLLTNIKPKSMMVEDYGNITVQAWVLDSYYKDGKEMLPVQSLLTYTSGSSPATICVTTNGQLVSKEHVNVLLRNTKLQALRDHMFIEVRIDDIIGNGNVITSNREGINDEFKTKLRIALEKFLKGHEEFGVSCDYLEQKKMSNNSNESLSTKISESIGSMLKNSILGNIFLGTGNIVDNTKPRNPPKPIKLLPIPTMIEVQKLTIVKGQTEWLRIRTNAEDKWADKIDISLKPDWLSEVPDSGKGLSKGKMSIQMKCDSSPSTDIGTITVRIEVSKGKYISCSRQVEAITEREAKKRKKKTSDKKGKSSMPAINISWVDSSDSSLMVGEVDANEVSYQSTLLGDNILISLNKDFKAYREAYSNIMATKGSSAADAFKSAYEQEIAVDVLLITTDTSDDFINDTNQYHKLKSSLVRSKIAMLQMNFTRNALMAI